MSDSCVHAIILAAGLGSRMLPFSEALPKPLLPVGFRRDGLDTCLARQLRQLGMARVQHTHVVVSHLSHLMVKHVDTLDVQEMSIDFAVQEQLNGEAGALFILADKVRGNVVVLDADNVFADDDIISAIIAEHIKHDADVTVGVASVDDVSGYAIVRLDSKDNVIDLVEKPSINPFNEPLAKTGLYVMKEWILRANPALAAAPDGSLNTTYLFRNLALAKRHRIRGYRLGCDFVDIGTWERFRHFWQLQQAR